MQVCEREIIRAGAAMNRMLEARRRAKLYSS